MSTELSAGAWSSSCGHRGPTSSHCLAWCMCVRLPGEAADEKAHCSHPKTGEMLSAMGDVDCGLWAVLGPLLLQHAVLEQGVKELGIDIFNMLF